MNTARKTVADFEALFGKVKAPEAITLRPLIVRAPMRQVPEYAVGRCCAAAVRVHCVCLVSWSCATHGATCVGSHD